MPKNTLPDWELVLSSAAHLQRILPDAVLVGGTASALYADHRLSRDADHVLTDLRSRFDEVLDYNGEKLTVPAQAEILRIKGVLILKRNATRDYLDFVALADHIGEEQMVNALRNFDFLYPQKNGESPTQQLQVQLSNPLPYDLEEVRLSEYKNLKPRWQNWDNVKKAGAHYSTVIFDKLSDSDEDQG